MGHGVLPLLLLLPPSLLCYMVQDLAYHPALFLVEAFEAWKHQSDMPRMPFQGLNVVSGLTVGESFHAVCCCHPCSRHSISLMPCMLPVLWLLLCRGRGMITWFPVHVSGLPLSQLLQQLWGCCQLLCIWMQHSSLHKG